MSNIVVGIDGGSCSGKTTLARGLAKKWDAVIVSKDDYYLSNSAIPPKMRENINFDHPSAFEYDLLVEHLRCLKRGEGVNAPIYDFTVHDRKDVSHRIEPTPIIIVEGIMILWSEALRDICDLKIYVDCDDAERLRRRVERDKRERGRTEESVIKQFYRDVLPMNKEYVEKYKPMADIVVSGSEIERAIFEAESFFGKEGMEWI